MSLLQAVWPPRLQLSSKRPGGLWRSEIPILIFLLDPSSKLSCYSGADENFMDIGTSQLVGVRLISLCVDRL